jgi:phosphoribosyl-ATP pyrophosphohydrolase/phosphoribosyl-AMP cyclohydrolase/histidinol dehydrogenase
MYPPQCLVVRAAELPAVDDAVLVAIRAAAGSADTFRVDVVVPELPEAAFDTIGAYHVVGINVEVAGVAGVAGVAAGAAAGAAGAAVDVEHVGRAIVSCLRTDRADGLYTTVVVDECEAALGLVYSSKESVVESMKCGRGVYYSRSRGGLWRKGDTSGAWQALKGIHFDCDSDALKFTVQQHGSPPVFCHLNRRSCWGGSQGLRHLEITLKERKATAPEGSYTKRLYDDAELLRNKLLEEAQELIEAENPDHVAAEVGLASGVVRCEGGRGAARRNRVERVCG